MVSNIRIIAQNIVLIIVGFIIFYNTGLHGDDYTAISYFEKKVFMKFFILIH